MCDSRSHGMDKIDICIEMGIDMNLGRCNMIFYHPEHAWENAARLEVF